MEVDPRLDLNKVIRPTLVRLEDSIILSLFERAQYKKNNTIYTRGAIPIENFEGSYFDFLLFGTERIHSLAGRYDHPQEYPFSVGLPDSVVERSLEESPIRTTGINFNSEIMKMYLGALDKICEPGDDGHYGSSAESDVSALQHLSRRIHFGSYVAESKFQENPELYRGLIKKEDTDGIWKALTNQGVEDKILERVQKKGMDYKVNPKFVEEFFRDKIIPLTKEVEVEYFYRREF